jgi:hypothetical protein
LQARALGDDDIEIEISHCGICGSDLHTADGGWGPVSYPCVVGLFPFAVFSSSSFVLFYLSLPVSFLLVLYVLLVLCCSIDPQSLVFSFVCSFDSCCLRLVSLVCIFDSFDRLIFALTGHEIVGKITAKGKGVTEFNVGDRVGQSLFYLPFVLSF